VTNSPVLVLYNGHKTVVAVVVVIGLLLCIYTKKYEITFAHTTV